MIAGELVLIVLDAEMLKAGDVKWVLVLLICAQWLALGRAASCEDTCDEEICPEFPEGVNDVCFGLLSCTVTGNNYSISYNIDVRDATAVELSLGLICGDACVPTRDVPVENSGIHQVMETISESETCRVTGCFRYDGIANSEALPVHFPLEDCVRTIEPTTEAPTTAEVPTTEAPTTEAEGGLTTEAAASMSESTPTSVSVAAQTTEAAVVAGSTLSLPAIISSFMATLVVIVIAVALLLVSVVIITRRRRSHGMEFVKVPFNNDKFDDQFQPPSFGIGQNAYKFLSVSERSILCTLYQQQPLQSWMQETALKEGSATPLSLSQPLLEDSVNKGSLTQDESNYTIFEDKLSSTPSKVPTFLDSPKLGSNSVSQGGGDVLEGDPINLDCPMEHKDLGYLDMERRGLGDGVTTPHSEKTLLNTLSDNPADDAGGSMEGKGYLGSNTSEGYIPGTGQDEEGEVTDVLSDPPEEDERKPRTHSLDFDLTTASDSTEGYAKFTPNQSMDMLELEMSHKSEAPPGDVSTPAFEGEYDGEMFDFDVPALEAQCDSAHYISHGSLHSNQSDSLHDQPKSLLQLDYVHDQSDSLPPVHGDRTKSLHIDQLQGQNDQAHCAGSDQSDYIDSAHEQSLSTHYVASTIDQSDASLYSQSDYTLLAHDGAVMHHHDCALDFEATSLHEELEQDTLDGDFMISSFQPRHASSSFELDKEPPSPDVVTAQLDGRVAAVNLDRDFLGCDEYIKGGSTDGYVASELLSPDFTNSPCPTPPPPSSTPPPPSSTPPPPSSTPPPPSSTPPPPSSSGTDVAEVVGVTARQEGGYIEGNSVEGDSTEGDCLEGDSAPCNYSNDPAEPLSPPFNPHCGEFGVDGVLSGMTVPFNQLKHSYHEQGSSFSCSTASSGYVLTSGGPHFCNSEQ